MSGNFYKFDSSEPISEIDFSKKDNDQVDSRKSKIVANLSSDVPIPINTEPEFNSFIDNLSSNIEVDRNNRSRRDSQSPNLSSEIINRLDRLERKLSRPKPVYQKERIVRSISSEGRRGPQGERGFPGPRGQSGERGSKGDIGSMGPRGYEGPRGLQGPIGQKGDRGAFGPPGPRGIPGERGLKGSKGDIGPRGLIGSRGDKGEKGDKGDKGQKGDKGDRGERGYMGPAGPPGSSLVTKNGNPLNLLDVNGQSYRVQINKNEFISGTTQDGRISSPSVSSNNITLGKTITMRSRGNLVFAADGTNLTIGSNGTVSINGKKTKIQNLEADTLTTKGGRSFLNPKNLPTVFNSMDGKNYIRGDTNMAGDVSTDGSIRSGKSLKIATNASKYNLKRLDTEFSAKDGVNYIRGDSELSGNTRVLGDITLSKGNKLKLRDNNNYLESSEKSLEINSDSKSSVSFIKRDNVSNKSVMDIVNNDKGTPFVKVSGEIRLGRFQIKDKGDKLIISNDLGDELRTIQLMKGNENSRIGSFNIIEKKKGLSFQNDKGEELHRIPYAREHKFKPSDVSLTDLNRTKNSSFTDRQKEYCYDGGKSNVCGGDLKEWNDPSLSNFRKSVTFNLNDTKLITHIIISRKLYQDQEDPKNYASLNIFNKKDGEKYDQLTFSFDFKNMSDEYVIPVNTIGKFIQVSSPFIIKKFQVFTRKLYDELRVEDIANAKKSAADRAASAARSKKEADEKAKAEAAARKKAEDAARKAAQAKKEAEENARKAAEEKRKTDAAKRKADEDARKAAKAKKEADEREKKARDALANAKNEAERKAAQDALKRAEEAKKKADEIARKAAQAKRDAAEKQREAAEAIRKAAEDRRKAAEAAMKAAEEKRKADAAAKAAQDARRKAMDENAAKALAKKLDDDRKRAEEERRKAASAVKTLNSINGLQLWLDAAKLVGKDGQKIDKWETSVTNGKNYFQNKTNNQNTYPVVKDKVLNNLPVLDFKSFQNMSLNTNIRSEEYTLIFLTRQVGGTNRRFLIGNGNKLLGYWNGGKDQLHMDGWLSPTPGAPPSNSMWDLYTIKRGKDRKTYMYRFGETIVNGNQGGTGFDGLYINTGGCCGGETSDGQIAEIAFWDKELTDSEVKTAEGYMAWKWGLQSELSESHTYNDKPSSLNVGISVPPTIAIIKEKLNLVNDLKLWFDASTLNQSGGVSELKSMAATKKKVALINGTSNKSQLPVVIQNGLNKLSVLEFNTQQSLSLSRNVRYNEFTFVFLTRQLGRTNRRFVIGNNNYLWGYWGGAKNQLHLDGWLTQAGTPPSNKDWDLYVVRRDKNNKVTMTRNGEKPIVNAVNWPHGFNGLYLNTGGCCGGETSDAQFAEMALWDRSLTQSEIEKIEGYMSWKWGLQNELPESHPFSAKPTEWNPNIMVPPAPKKEKFNSIGGLKVWFDATTIKSSGPVQELESIAISRKKYSLKNQNSDSSRYPVLKNNILNKLPVLEFNTNQNLSLNRSLVADEFTMIFVTRHMGGNNRRFVIGDGNRLYGYWGGGKDQLYMEGWLVPAPGNPRANTEWDIYVIRRERDGRTYMHRNGSKELIVKGGRAANFNGLFLNTGGCCGGETSDAQFAELAFWEKSLTSTEIEKAEGYLAWKWGLNTDLDESHPYANKPTEWNVGAIIPIAPIKAKLNTIAGMKLWIDASTLKGSNSDKVKEIKSMDANKKSNALVNKSNDSNQYPTIKSNELNNLPVLNFRTNNNMSLAKPLQYKEFTFIFLSRQNGGNNRRLLIGDSNILYGYWGGAKDQLHIDGWLTPAGTPRSNTEWDLYTISRNSGGQVSMSRNGRTIVNPRDWPHGFNNLYINTGGCCGGETSDGQIAEITLWNRMLSQSEIDKVTGYISWKWGVQKKLPSNHEYFTRPTEWNK